MTLKIIVWNVQHGSAAYIQTPNSKHIAIDLGASEATNGGFSPLAHLQREGIKKLDHVTITHPHMDHFDDILRFDELHPGSLLIPKHLTENNIRNGNPKPSPEADEKIRKYLEISGRYTNPVTPENSIKLPENNGGVSIQTFIPNQASTGNLNNHSVVSVVEYSGVKILIPGDNEPPSWEELLSQSRFTTAIEGTHVLVAPHHGRESGFHGPLFDHFHPLITLISDGRTVDTSATDRYSAITQGLQVSRRNGTIRNRKCVTTRNDGHIEVKVIPSAANDPTLAVTID
jgi:beta-lactamase superfamily II metal-dependent hydrolase